MRDCEQKKVEPRPFGDPKWDAAVDFCDESLTADARSQQVGARGECMLHWALVLGKHMEGARWLALGGRPTADAKGAWPLHWGRREGRHIYELAGSHLSGLGPAASKRDGKGRDAIGLMLLDGELDGALCLARAFPEAADRGIALFSGERMTLGNAVIASQMILRYQKPSDEQAAILLTRLRAPTRKMPACLEAQGSLWSQERWNKALEEGATAGQIAWMDAIELDDFTSIAKGPAGLRARI